MKITKLIDKKLAKVNSLLREFEYNSYILHSILYILSKL